MANDQSEKPKSDCVRPMLIEEMEFRANRLFGEVIERLRERRESKGLSQRDVSALAQISQSHLCEIETGEKKPTWNQLSKICYTLDTTIAAMIVNVVFAGQDEGRTIEDQIRLQEFAAMAQAVSAIPAAQSKEPTFTYESSHR